jgi:predicted unusual protein kinase regulating ubiquinone biosynthesis (AarF/ABC1/UbiB family)
MCFKNIKFYFFQFYNIIVLFINIRKIVYNINNIENEESHLIVGGLKKNINSIGIFAIKLVQWVIEKLKLTSSDDKTLEILDQFNNYYEDCPVHEYDFTKKIYFESFNDEIDNKYVIEKTPIASGSIGQVYKGYLKDNKNIKIAMKVVHPNIDRQLLIPRILLKVYNNISYLFSLGFYIPLNFDDFFDYLNMQINLNYEKNNMEVHRENYKDNSFIVIPKVYESSKNILIMSYEDGSFFENLQISNYQKSKILTILRLYIRSSLVCNNIIHGDLHNGNWKVRKHPTIKNNYQIILYDLGLCAKLKNNSFMIRFYKYCDYDDKDKLSDLMIEASKYKLNDAKKKFIKIKLLELFNNLELNKRLIIKKILKKTIEVLTSNNVIIESVYFNIFCTAINTGNHISKYCDLSSDYSVDIQKDCAFKEIYPSLIAFCDTYNCFNNYGDIMKSIMNNDKKEYELFPDLKKKLKCGNMNNLLDIDSDLDSDSDVE